MKSHNLKIKVLYDLHRLSVEQVPGILVTLHDKSFRILVLRDSLSLSLCLFPILLPFLPPSFILPFFLLSISLLLFFLSVYFFSFLFNISLLKLHSLICTPSLELFTFLLILLLITLPSILTILLRPT